MISGFNKEGFETPAELIEARLLPVDIQELFPQSPRLQQLTRALMMSVGDNTCRADMLTAAAVHEKHAPLATITLHWQRTPSLPWDEQWPTIRWATASNLHATNEVEWAAPSVSRWAREAQAFTWQPVGEDIDDLINFGQVSFVIREFGPRGRT